jgi:hypothetical protein
MIEHFSNHVQRGFTAFDMADHYGDAEIIFVCCMTQILSSLLTEAGRIPFFERILRLDLRSDEILCLPPDDSL